MKDQKKPHSARLLEKAQQRGVEGSDTRGQGYRLLLGLFLSTAISLFAYRRRSLSPSGVAGAVVTGTTTFGLGGWDWGLSLVFFFVSSSMLSHFREHEKAAAAADKFSKGSRRDLGQVVANGGVATLLALGYGLARTHALRETLQAGYREPGHCDRRHLGHRARRPESAAAAPGYQRQTCLPWYFGRHYTAWYWSCCLGCAGIRNRVLGAAALSHIARLRASVRSGERPGG